MRLKIFPTKWRHLSWLECVKSNLNQFKRKKMHGIGHSPTAFYASESKVMSNKSINESFRNVQGSFWVWAQLMRGAVAI